MRRDHPLRSIRAVVNETLDALSGAFAALYGSMGRPSIPPEMLLRAMLLQAFYSIRSERQLMELGPAFIAFKRQEREMRLIALTAWIDVRYDARTGGPVAEFSWEGDQRSGRGWAALGTAGRLVGHVYIHRGDDSGFVCEPW